MDIRYLLESSAIVYVASLLSSFDSIFADGKKLVNNLSTQFLLLYLKKNSSDEEFLINLHQTSSSKFLSLNKFVIEFRFIDWQKKSA